jgi:uncharacterized protein DUF2017
VFRRRPFRRGRDGRILVRLEAAEVELLRSLAGELGELLAAGDRSDPATARLFPRAYLDPTEEAAEIEWQALSGASLVSERLDRLAALIEATDADGTAPAATTIEIELDDEGEVAWLGVINDARLALGSRIGVTDDDDLSGVADDDPRSAAVAVYGWLTWLQGELVEVLLAGQPVQGLDD